MPSRTAPLAISLRQESTHTGRKTRRRSSGRLRQQQTFAHPRNHPVTGQRAVAVRQWQVNRFSPQRQPPPENSRHRRWEDPVFNAARYRAVDTALIYALAACPMLTDACTRALSALWEAAFDLRSARVRAHPGAGSIARARLDRARCGNARSAMRGTCASLAEWGERSRGK